MSAEKTRIVIVDDEQDLCFLLSGMLRAQGFDVESFFTLRAGLAGINRIQPDWVILDNNLPDGLGWDNNPRIMEAAPHVNIINISANPDSSRSAANSRVHYLIKPIDVNSIVDLIRNSSAR